ncbi:MAG: hypothetical protein LUE98_19560 [Tannerellaceae bacterium]|nr:hypothetical protein [Tannerellaceae bacterium]
MKKIIALLAIILASATLVPVQAQNVNININLNIDRQPAWGPIGYKYVDYYYFPDINIYYDVNNGLFYYSSRGKWIADRYLPAKYRTYDLYVMYKVVLNERQPWVYNKVHRRQYAHFRGDRTQVVIRNTTDSRYRKSRYNTVSWVDNSRTSNKTTSSRTSSSNRSTSTSSSRTSTSSSRSSATQSSNSSSSSRSSGTTSTQNNNSSRTSSSRTR